MHECEAQPCAVHALKPSKMRQHYAKIISLNYDRIEWTRIRLFSDAVMLDPTPGVHRLDDATDYMLNYIAEIAPGFTAQAREIMHRLYGEESK